MSNAEIKQYMTLNELAEQGGTVIFGGSEDKMIPLCELKQAFFPDAKLYNRSIVALTVREAVEYYAECVAPLEPACVLLHLGAADLPAFLEDAARFDNSYRALIRGIRAMNGACRIAVISLKNPDGAAEITEMNRHLRIIAESERCEFGDISSRRVWNPGQTREILSFVHAMGFGRAARKTGALYDLVKILFGNEISCVN